MSQLHRHMRRLWHEGHTHDRSAYREAFRRIRFYQPRPGAPHALAILHEPGHVMTMMAIVTGDNPLGWGGSLVYGNS